MANSPHIVVVPLPSQGHLTPLLHLSRKLAARGFSITMVNVESVHQQILKQWACPPEQDIRLEAIPFSFVIPKSFDSKLLNNRGPLLDALDELHVPFGKLVSRLLDSGLRISWIISDYFVSWTTPVALKHGIPQVCYFPGAAAWSLVDYHTPQLFANSDIPVPDSEEFNEKNSRLISYIPGMDPFKQFDLPFYLHQRWVHGLGMKRILGRQARLRTDAWILTNSFYELEPREFETMRKIVGKKVICIGPLFPLDSNGAEPLSASLETEELQCLKWLDKRPKASVLYVSFGSLAILSPREFEELALGLEASKQSFLWVIRPELLDGIRPAFYEGFKQRTAAAEHASLIIPWAPQLRVLSHASVGGFLTHCGWNSTLESICHGVPMLGWPCHSEQNLNCRLVVEGKMIGMAFAKGSDVVVPKEQVARLVKQLMASGEGMRRERVRQLKDAARRAAAQGGSSHDNLETFMQHLRTTQSNGLRGNAYAACC